MLAMLVNRGGPSQPSQRAGNSMQQVRQGGGGGPSGGRRGQPSDDDVERVRQTIMADPATMQKVREDKPELAAVVHDRQAFRDAWMAIYRANEENEREKARQIERLNQDPFDVEAQTRIEEMIREQNVMENLQHAYENSPEGMSSHDFIDHG
jgi:DNA damage-inducible protein 1